MKYTYRHTVHACYFGYITQAIVNNLAPILFIVFQNKFNISFEMIGRLILVNFTFQLIVDALAAKFVDRIGYRVSIVSAHLFSAAGLILLGILPNILPNPYVGLLLSITIYAIGGGLIEVLISPILNALPDEAKASMSLLHSFYCWGQVAVVLLSTLALRAMKSDMWFVLPVLWSLIPIYNLIKFIKVPLVPPIPDHEKMPVRELISTKLFIVAVILMVTAGASELAMAQWSSLFAEKGLKVPKVMGDLLGPCLFAVLMGLGRAVHGIWGKNLEIRKVLLASAGLCIACYAVTAFVQIPIISLLGCALCGLSVSLMWPGVFIMTANRFPKGGTAMFGILAIFGDLGCALGSWLTGVVSDAAQKSLKLLELGSKAGLNAEQVGLKAGIAATIVFPLTMFLFIAFVKEDRKASSEKA